MPMFQAMPDLDLEPHEFRRKGGWIVRHFNVDKLLFWAPVLGVLGPCTAGLIYWVFPSAPVWLLTLIMLGPGVGMILMYVALEGTRKRLADPRSSPQSAGERLPPELGRASPRARKVVAASRAALPKSGSDPTNFRSP